MPAAARLGDPTSDGDTIAAGSGNVFINGMPAARVGDTTAGHGCFPPTTIQAGSSTVFINGIPAARVGDPIVPHACPLTVPHGGTIASGSGNVNIG